ncbi:MAG: dodecin family protein [archaeon]
MVVKVIEIIGESELSWEDAAQDAVATAAETVRNIQGVEIVGWTGSVENGKITKFKATIKIAFVVESGAEL